MDFSSTNLYKYQCIVENFVFCKSSQPKIQDPSQLIILETLSGNNFAELGQNGNKQLLYTSVTEMSLDLGNIINRINYILNCQLVTVQIICDANNGTINHYYHIKQGHQHNYHDQVALRPHILCSICIHSFGAHARAVRLFIASLHSQPMCP